MEPLDEVCVGGRDALRFEECGDGGEGLGGLLLVGHAFRDGGGGGLREEVHGEFCAVWGAGGDVVVVEGGDVGQGEFSEVGDVVFHY